MCAPVAAVVPIIAAAAAVAGGVALSEQQKADQADKMLTPDPKKLEEQAKRSTEAMSANAQRPKRANAAEALYGNPARLGGGGDGGAPSSGITTQVNALPTALSLGKSNLLGQ